MLPKSPINSLEAILNAGSIHAEDLKLKKILSSLISEDVGAIIVKDLAGVILQWSHGAEKVFGYTAQEAVGKSIELLLPPENKEEETFIFERILKSHQIDYFKTVRICKDGKKVSVSLKISPILNSTGDVIGATTTFWHMTQKQRDLIQLDLMVSSMTHGDDVIIISEAEPIDRPGPRIVYVNDAFERLTGYTREEAIGNTPRMLQGPKSDPIAMHKIHEALLHWKSVRVELINYTKDGKEFWVELDIKPLADSNGWYTHWISVQREITERKTDAAQIEDLAFYDQLTNLPNRILLINRLQQELLRNTRSKQFGALLFIDLDHFKSVNDTMGHGGGDELLIEVAARLLSCVRKSDTVSRFGGDEFVIILNALHEDILEAGVYTAAVASKILGVFEDPFLAKNKSIFSSPSIGICLFSGHHEDTFEDVLKQADMAMYEAKKSGRNTYQFFDEGMQSLVNGLVSMEENLRIALKLKQFCLLYQSQVNQLGQIIGAEALLRINHPENGLIAPGEFISIAEDTGLIIPIGYWVLETACEQLAKWAEDRKMAQLTLAVNISGRQFKDPIFVETVLSILQKTGANPRLLRIEPTESILIENLDETIKKMKALTEVGVDFSLDDFGTGYSSLSYLKSLPITQLKIDSSFIADVPYDFDACTIVIAIIDLAKKLGISVIAEGVETEEQREYLLDNGCNLYQGYLFSHPILVSEFSQLVANQQTPSDRSA